MFEETLSPNLNKWDKKTVKNQWTVNYLCKFRFTLIFHVDVKDLWSHYDLQRPYISNSPHTLTFSKFLIKVVIITFFLYVTSTLFRHCPRNFYIHFMSKILESFVQNNSRRVLGWDVRHDNPELLFLLHPTENFWNIRRTTQFWNALVRLLVYRDWVNKVE